MVSFRRCILALMVLALFAGLASAQVGTSLGSAAGPLLCTASVAVPPQLRAESITDQIGDVVLSCTGGSAPLLGGTVPTANITVSLGTNVTSRIIGGGNASEALLIIDEPGTSLTGTGPGLPGYTGPFLASPLITCSSAAAGAGPGGCGPVFYSTTGAGYPTTTTTGLTPAPNVYQGVVSGNQVTFNGVPILAPVTSGLSRVFRITNVRANVAGLGGAGLAGTTQLLASVSISGSTALPVSNPVLIAGFIQNGLSVSVRNPANSSTISSSSGAPSALGFLQCTSENNGSNFGGTGVNGINAVLRFQENFATAFKTRVSATATTSGLFSPTGAFQNIPGTIYNSESGFILPINGGTAGLADFGTRLRAVFSNIPSGVSIFVTTTNFANTTASTGANSGTFSTNTTTPGNLIFLPNGPTTAAQPTIAVLVQSETAPDFANTAPIVNFTNAVFSGTTTLAPVALVNGSGEAVWEIVGANPNSLDIADFGVVFQFAANPGAANGGSPAVGVTGKVNMSFAPVSSTTTASSGPIPRFVDNSGSGSNIINVSICQTLLLFPFVTNENGFETGMSIANASTDPYLGLTNQNGSCVISFYGDNAVATTTTAPCTLAGACTGTIATGKVYANTLSGLTGGSAFQGYALALCNFQFAHGFAFISDSHATNLAMGYLALIRAGGESSGGGLVH